MKLALSGTLEGLVAAKAARLGITAQDALRMLAVQWVQDEPLPVPSRVPQGSLAVPGGTFKEGVLAVSSSDSPIPSTVLSAETGKEGSSGGGEEHVVEGVSGPPAKAPEKRKRDRRRVVEAPPPILPENIAAVPGLPEALLAFADFRRTSKHGPMTERAWTLLYNALSRFAGRHARLAVEWARAKGWATWEPKFTEGSTWDTIAALLGDQAEQPARTRRAVSEPEGPPPATPGYSTVMLALARLDLPAEELAAYERQAGELEAAGDIEALYELAEGIRLGRRGPGLAGLGGSLAGGAAGAGGSAEGVGGRAGDSRGAGAGAPFDAEGGGGVDPGGLLPGAAPLGIRRAEGVGSAGEHGGSRGLARPARAPVADRGPCLPGFAGGVPAGSGEPPGVGGDREGPGMAAAGD